MVGEATGTKPPCSADVNDILGTKQANLPRALMWAEKPHDDVLEPTTVTAERLLETDDNEAVRRDLLVNTRREPRAMVGGCLGKRFRSVKNTAWLPSRAEPNRCDPTVQVDNATHQPYAIPGEIVQVSLSPHRSKLVLWQPMCQ